jgi:hypothetical protein
VRRRILAAHDHLEHGRVPVGLVVGTVNQSVGDPESMPRTTATSTAPEELERHHV